MSMERFRAKFGKDRVVTPVIHVDKRDVALSNIELARACGADGVWLISHGHMSAMTLSFFQKKCIDETSWSQIGINLLGTHPIAVFEMADTRGMGVWTDNAYVGSNIQEGVECCYDIDDHRSLLGDSLYFGGVAFKYQAQPEDLAGETEDSTRHVDVIATSGSGTGKAAHVSKIKTMWEAASGHPIAIASGITPENVAQYLPYTNAFMVATGINVDGDFLNIDEAKLKALVEIVKNYGQT